MKDNKISIIVPVYNSEQYLDECIESILKQTYENFELILVDDGSTDNSPGICDKYSKQDSRIKKYHIKNNGVSNARNFGISKSTGEWITFVDSDDIINENYCLYLINAATKEENIDMVIGRTISFINDDVSQTIDDGYSGGVEDKLSTKEEKEELYKSIFIDNHKFIKYPHISTCSAKLIRKKILVENNIFYEKNMFLYEDALLNLNVIFSSNSVAIIDKKIYLYRTNNSSSTNKFNPNIISQYDFVYEKFEDFSNSKKMDFIRYMDYFKVKNLNTILTNYYKCNKYNRKFNKKLIESYHLPLKKVEYSKLPKKRKLLKLLSSFGLNFAIYILYKIK